MSTPADPVVVAGSLQALSTIVSLSSLDYAAAGDTAMLYGVVVGWGCEEAHDHDWLCGGDGALLDVCARHGLDLDQLRALRADYRARAAAAEVA
jgi:hypothetical protein